MFIVVVIFLSLFNKERLMSDWPSLQLLSGPYKGKEVTVGSSMFVMGRDPDCDFWVNEGELSRYHCRICRRDGGTWFIKDLESVNGVRVNQVRVTDQMDLRDSDQIRIGDMTMVFRCASLINKREEHTHLAPVPVVSQAVAQNSTPVVIVQQGQIASSQDPAETAEVAAVTDKASVTEKARIEKCHPQDLFYFCVIGLMIGFCFGFLPVLAASRVMSFDSGCIPHFSGVATAIFGAYWNRTFHSVKLVGGGKAKYDFRIVLFYVVIAVVVLLSFAIIVVFPVATPQPTIPLRY